MKARLDEEMGAPPPATIDVDALMSRGRRQVRLRRFVAVGGGAGLSMVALGTAVAVAVNGGGTPGAPTGFGAPASASASVPNSAPGSASTSPTAAGSPEERLTTVVKALVQQYAPGATATKDASGREPLKVLPGSAYNSGAAYDTSANLTVGGGTGMFYIGIGRGAGWNMITECGGGYNDGSGRTCARSTGPAGETIVRITEPTDGGEDKAFLVYITRADGTGVFLIADDGNEHGNRAGTRDEPVFTHDQLVKIGTDPRWTL
jgi:hypothetical protein